MRHKSTLLALLLFALYSSVFGQQTTSATYTLGDIAADAGFQIPSQSSTCPGELTVSIPVGSTITSVDVVYNFEAIAGSGAYIAFQRSQLRCVSPGGVSESIVTAGTDFTTGVKIYTRSSLTIANGVTGGGNIMFQLHAGNTKSGAVGCSTQYLKVNNGTWTVTVHYNPPGIPTVPTNPNPADKTTGVSINVGTLSWTFGDNTATYDLYFGTNNPPTTKVADNQPAGATGTYPLSTLLPGKNYYWKVVARSVAGTELSGPVWNFGTECLPAGVPIMVDFDDLVVPVNGSREPPSFILPLCWSMLYQCSLSYASQGVYQTPYAFTAPNCWIFSNEGDAGSYNIMIMPEMQASLNNLQLSFMARTTNSNTTMSVGTMADKDNPATFTQFTTFIATPAYQQFDIPFSSYSGTDKYLAVKFTSPGPNTYHYVFIDNVLISEIPGCPRPKNLTAVEVTQETAQVTWLETGSATQWNIEVVPAGTSPTGNFTAINSNPFTISGLQPSTSYNFYVQADCGNGNLSYWSNKGTFKTSCLPNTVPFLEKFDASTSLPACWSVVKTLTGSTWTIQNYSSYSAPNNFTMNNSFVDGVVILVSPPLGMPDGSLKELKLNFFAKRAASEQSIIVGTISNPLDYTSFTPIKTIIPPTSNTWSEYEVWFNTYTGTDNYIAFKCGNITNSGSVNLDNINFGLLPYCINPIDLYVNDIHETDARLHWTESRVATNWQIEIGPVGFVPGTNTFTHSYTHQLVGNDYSFVMTGLEPGNFYDVYMRADCGGGDLSLWSPKAQFMSQPLLYSPLPFIETFDPGFTYTTNPPTNNVNWTLFTTLYHSSPNSARNQYTGMNKNVLLISKRFDLTNKTNAFLSFWHIAKTDGDKDHCYVEISTDGGANYDQIPISAYIGLGKYYQPLQNLPEGPCFDEDSYADWGTGTETPLNTWWKNENFDLSAYSNSNNVVIRFRLVTDNSTNKYGWLIDDVSINTYDGPLTAVNPLTFDVEVKPNQSTSENLTISNNGNLPVVYTASVQNFTDNITTIVSQDFETGVPAGWTIINGTESTSQSWWQWAETGVAQYNLNNTNYMFVGRFYPDICSETLISPEFNGVGHANVFLTFDNCYIKASSGSAPDYAQVLIWDGSAWQQLIYMKTANVGAWGNPDKTVYDITQFVNPNMKVKFYYNGTNTSRWGVDNFSVTASDIPLNWLTLNTKTSVSGLLQGGQSQNIDVGFATRPTFPNGIWHSEIQITSNDPVNSPITIPVSMTIGCLQPWQYLQTGVAHSLSIPHGVVPEIFGVPLADEDWIGVFYLDDNNQEACGGALQWNGTGGLVIDAYGDDPGTPQKDGFADGEAFRWRLKQCGNTAQYAAAASYDPGMPDLGNFVANGQSKLINLHAAYLQYYSFNQGWNGVSSYIVPSDPQVVNMFTPIAGNLTILRNLTALYWPSEGYNTIGSWDNNSGYVLKVNGNTNFIINGSAYAGKTITLSAGWQYLPVLSQCPVDVLNMFGSNLSDIIIIQELIGTRIFWPAMQIYSLETLEPGKAYLVKMANEITLTFPDCAAKDFGNPKPQVNHLDTPWGTLHMGPSTQIALFMPEALNNFVDGDMIGAFDQKGHIFGYSAVSGIEKNLSITLFGEDNTSREKDSFINNEPISFKLLRSSTGEESDLEIGYSEILENTTGNFIEGSFSAISKVKMGPAGIVDPPGSAIHIFPNPTTEILNISGISAKSGISIFDVFGNEVYAIQLEQSSTINLGSLAKGAYVVQISNNSHNTYKKLILE